MPPGRLLYLKALLKIPDVNQYQTKLNQTLESLCERGYKSSSLKPWFFVFFSHTTQLSCETLKSKWSSLHVPLALLKHFHAPLHAWSRVCVAIKHLLRSRMGASCSHNAIDRFFGEGRHGALCRSRYRYIFSCWHLSNHRMTEKMMMIMHIRSLIHTAWKIQLASRRKRYKTFPLRASSFSSHTGHYAVSTLATLESPAHQLMCFFLWRQQCKPTCAGAAFSGC
jgi:hypothetical protein